MGIKTSYEITCNLCGNTHKGDSNVLPRFWLNMLIENPYVDRDFTEKHICNCCALDIHDRHKKSKSA